MTGSRFDARRLGIFNAVFATAPPSQPTPEIQYTQSGQTFGGPSPKRFAHDREPLPTSRDRGTVADHKLSDQSIWDRSWHVVTDYFVKLHGGLDASLGGITSENTHAPDASFIEALRNIVCAETLLPQALDRESLGEWIIAQSRTHFMRAVLPHILQISFEKQQNLVLESVVDTLHRTYEVYLYGMSLYIKALGEQNLAQPEAMALRLRQDLQALITTAVLQRLSQSLRLLLDDKISVILGMPSDDSAPPSMSQRESERDKLLACIDSLYAVGLCGDEFQIILAEVMSRVMTRYIYGTYSKKWQAQSPPFRRPLASLPIQTEHGQQRQRYNGCSFDDAPGLLPHEVSNSVSSESVWDLCDWIENRYARLAMEILNRLVSAEVSWANVEVWKEMGIGRLAFLRTGELFEVSKTWPNSMGALNDLRASINTPQKPLQLTDSFAKQLREHLLHPGTSTLQILRVYISMIRSFHALDHSKVLLDRVAFPLQLYLCSRDDTVRIIITGLLSDTDISSGKEPAERADILIELAEELNSGRDSFDHRVDEKLDWDDPDWQPDPVDAGPGYKRTKSADVIGTLIGVLGSPEIFIKEFQSIIGENLLRLEDDFAKELKLLELLKSRFGDAQLQACEVMVRDVLMSRELNAAIRENTGLLPSSEEIALAVKAPRRMNDLMPVSAEGLIKPSVHAKILSRLFWPSLPTDTFRVPTEVDMLQTAYAKQFETLKIGRKLQWLPALGQVKVELDLEDRVIVEEVHTWQATVIWAFEPHSPMETGIIQRSVDYLTEHLQMDEDTIHQALSFWVGKMVLKQVSPDNYEVLETLSKADRELSNAMATSASHKTTSATDTMGIPGSAKNETGIGKEKGVMYWQFIQGMLKNSAAQMPVAQVSMMLKMMIPEGFPFGDEDLKAFLNEKVDEGALEVKGGRYKLKK